MNKTINCGGSTTWGPLKTVQFLYFPIKCGILSYMNIMVYFYPNMQDTFAKESNTVNLRDSTYSSLNALVSIQESVPILLDYRILKKKPV